MTTALKGVYKPLGKAGKRFYVDVHSTAVKNSGKRKLHVVFDGQGFLKVGRFSEIPAEAGDVVYVDVLTQTVYDDVLGLLKRGVQVFRLRRTDIIPEYRSGAGLMKSDENDAKTLSMIDESCFVEVSADYVELMKLLEGYYKHMGVLKLLKQNSSVDFNEARSLIQRNKDRLAREIIKKAVATIPEYGRVCETLGLSRRCLYGKAALADLLLHVDFSVGLRRILCYVGLYKPNNGKYNHRLKQAAISLAISHYGKHRVKAKEVRNLLKTIKQTLAGGPA